MYTSQNNDIVERCFDNVVGHVWTGPNVTLVYTQLYFFLLTINNQRTYDEALSVHRLATNAAYKLEMRDIIPIQRYRSTVVYCTDGILSKA